VAVDGTTVTGEGAARSWRVAAVGVPLLAIFLVRLPVDEPALGLGFIAALPIVAAALWFGRAGALLAACAATVLWGLDEIIAPSDDLGGIRTAVAMLTRAGVYFGVALLAGELVARQRQLGAQREELAELRVLQEALVPGALPVLPGLELGAAYRPAHGVAAGDFHIVVPGRDDRTIMVVGDVCGHGLSAARRAAFVRASIANLSRFESEPRALLELINRQLHDYEDVDEDCDFVTAVAASIDPSTQQVSWATAGHPAPWRMGAEPLLLEPEAPGQPLGVSPEVGGRGGTAALAPGEGLLLYTDGLIEARHVTGNGQRSAAAAQLRVGALLREMDGARAETVVLRLSQDVVDRSGGRLEDDVCLLAARRSGGSQAI
jgi:serine phosphatase RsbU (regulator of sigma subunit)